MLRGASPRKKKIRDFCRVNAVLNHCCSKSARALDGCKPLRSQYSQAKLGYPAGIAKQTPGGGGGGVCTMRMKTTVRLGEGGR